MHVFISGPSGVGKTSVINELSSRGYNAFDTDMYPDMARLELLETGEPVEWPEGGFMDWKKYGWCINPPVLNTLLDTHDDVFLSGICHNQPDFYHRFGKLIVLTCSIEEYERRMRVRPHRGANDDEINIQNRIQKYPIMIDRLTSQGFIPVDHSGSPTETADAILRIIKSEKL